SFTIIHMVTTTIEEFLGNVVESVDGIESITIADREGVEILSATSSHYDEQSNDDQILTTIFSLTSDQCSKLPEFGACSFVIARYDDGKQLLQATMNTPLVITMMANAEKIDRSGLLSVLDDVMIASKEFRLVFDQQQQHS
ncbi:Mitogen-activated protein kinase kinase 1-interacting protein, putative, partial [Perkinsus marinus ATCC 50983]